MEEKTLSHFFLEGSAERRFGYIYTPSEHKKVLELLLEKPDAAAQFKKPFEYENKLEWCPEIKGFVAYVLMCKNGNLYKGHTGNFKQRMLQHFNGYGGATTKRNRPTYIFHHEEYETKATAIAREIFFKTGEGTAWLKSSSVIKTIKP